MKRITWMVAALVALTAAEATAQSRTPAHTAAAIELVESMNLRATLESSLNTMLRMQIQSSPELEPFEEVMRAFFQKYVSWDALKDDYVELYAQEFTEPELRQLAEFYRSPLGRKVAEATPRLSAQGAQIGQRAVEEHMGELQQAVLQRMQEMQRQNDRP